MDYILAISIVINVFFILYGSFIILKRGAKTYLKGLLKIESEHTNSKYGIHYDTKLEFFEHMPVKSDEIIFLGDSLTAMSNWNELFEKEKIKNRGISGDKINGVIHRLDEVVRFMPKKIFLMIGINDLGSKRKVDEIVTDYEYLINLILTKTSKSELYIQSLLPTKNHVTRQNKDILEINRRLLELSHKYDITFINLFDAFKTDKNELNMNFSYDGLHLNAEGYLIWKKNIVNFIED
ncbi:GDSL-type esterase/lipase family protein [Psychroserpens mesophilus]|uniref:GDSL-type esterase/lipase family protein n=1 Tax=Psychroserpens mesophilus TaxID=325473 RepID=UPI003F497969